MKQKFLKPLIRKGALLVAGAGLEVLETSLLKQVKALNLPRLASFIENRLDELMCIVRIFLDDNPDNKDQLMQLVDARVMLVADDATELAADFVKLKIKDPVLAASMERMLRAAIEEQPIADAHEGVVIYKDTEGKRLN